MYQINLQTALLRSRVCHTFSQIVYRDFLSCTFFVCFIHAKNNFMEVSKNLATYRSENNIVGLSKLLHVS